MIHIKDLTFGYKKNQVLFNQLSLELNSGKIYGLLGKNGAGKTTLLKQIMGLSFPDQGICKVMDFDSKNRTPEFLKNIFIVPEEFELPPMKISEFIMLHAPFYPDFNNDLFNSCMKDFEMLADEKIQNLSFGQKKKVLLSFGMAANTKILLLDEPTNALDIPSKITFRKLVASMFADDKIVIISTHQVRDLESLIDSVIVLNNGQIVFNYTIEEISSMLKFSKLNDDSINENVLYREDILGGSYAIMKNTDDAATKIDLEFLFNGIIQNANEFNNYLKK